MVTKSYKRINIEISNVCNLQCSFCPEVERPKKVMAPAMLKDILAQAAPLADEVCLHLMGEPLGHPQFPELIALCAEAGTPVNLSTNGLLLRGAIAEAATHPIVRQLNISIHSYLDNYPSADPGPYIEKISKILDRVEELRPDLYVNLRLWDLVDGQSSSKSGTILRQHLEQKFGIDLAPEKIDIRRKKTVRLRGRISVHHDSRFVWPSVALEHRSEVGTCMGLRTHFGIHADGTVVPCCLDKEAVINLGNVVTSSLLEILQSQRAKNIKEGFENHQLREDLCRKCSFISRFDRKKKSSNATVKDLSL